MHSRNFLACILALVSCKPEDDRVDSGLPASEQGKDLLPDEQEQLCESVLVYLYAHANDDPKKWTCRADAVINATMFMADCEASYADCVAEPEEVPGSCSFGPTSWTGCTATIAEIEACYTDYQNNNVAIRNDLTCDKIAEYKVHWPFDDYRYSERCRQALVKCPDLLPPDGTPDP